MDDSQADYPAKLVRLTVMAERLLSELHQAPLDALGTSRAAELWRRELDELVSCLPASVIAEFNRVAPALGESPTYGEVTIAQAQLGGWLEGALFALRAEAFTDDGDAAGTD